MEESSAVGVGRFGSGIARQQGGDGGAGGLAFEQHTAYGGGDGQFYVQALTQLQGGAGAAHAFGGHAARQNVVEAAALADGQPDLPVARERAGGGEHQVAQAGEPLRSEEHTSELQSRENLVCRLLLEKRTTS